MTHSNGNWMNDDQRSAMREEARKKEAMPEPEARCELCGEPMPPGETMFKFHGYSGPCPKPPLPKTESGFTPQELADNWKVAGESTPTP